MAERETSWISRISGIVNAVQGLQAKLLQIKSRAGAWSVWAEKDEASRGAP